MFVMLRPLFKFVILVKITVPSHLAGFRLIIPIGSTKAQATNIQPIEDNYIQAISAKRRHMASTDFVSTGPSNGELPGGTEPPHKPMLTYYQRGPLAFMAW